MSGEWAREVGRPGVGVEIGRRKEHNASKNNQVRPQICTTVRRIQDKSRIFQDEAEISTYVLRNSRDRANFQGKLKSNA